MVATIFLIVLAVVFGVVWMSLARRPGPRAKIGPDGTNERNPESFVVHHEGKDQGSDIANAALRERRAGAAGAGAAGGNAGAGAGAAGAVPGAAGGNAGTGVGAAPGALDAKGRNRDMELAREPLPSTPAPGRGKVVLFRTRNAGPDAGDEITFNPDPSWAEGAPPDPEWSALEKESSLPADYGEDAVVAMVRNPRSLYVYWESSGFGDENLRAMLGEAEWQRTEPCLRIYDVTAGAYPGQAGGHTFAIEVSEQADHHFINEGIRPGHRYVVSYERRTDDGQYYMISHSGPVGVPPEAPATESELHRLHGRQSGEWSGSPWR